MRSPATLFPEVSGLQATRRSDTCRHTTAGVSLDAGVGAPTP